MQKHKLIRGILMHNQITDIDDLNQIEMVSGTTDGKIYFYDVEGDYVYANWNTTTPVIVDSNTTGITVSPASVTLFNTGTTRQLVITNQNGDDVTFECTFLSNNTTLVTASTSGLLTASSTAGVTGVTTVKVTHPDIPTLTGFTTVTVSRATTSITVTGNTSMNAYLVSAGTIAVYSQDGRNVTTECTYTSSSTGVTTIGASTGIMTINGTGTTTITATHVDGATGSTTVTVTGKKITSATVVPTGTTVAYSGSSTIVINDQDGANITQYCNYSDGSAVYISSFTPGTGVVVFDGVAGAEPTLAFGSTVWGVYGSYKVYFT